MSQKISYKDALNKNLDKTFEITKKTYVVNYTKKDLKKICIFGNINELMKIPKKYFTEEIKNYLLENMKDKLIEIEIWKHEDQNQLDCKLEEFSLRTKYINECVSYIESIF